MNFSEKKQKEFSKSAVVTLFETNHDKAVLFFDELKDNKNFIVDADYKINDESHIRIRDISYVGAAVFAHITFYNPKAKVSVTPKAEDKAKDLFDIDNFDNCHLFLCVSGNYIRAIFQLSVTWPITRLDRFFKTLKMSPKITHVIDKTVIKKIKDEGFKELHLQTTVHATDLPIVNTPLHSLIAKEPKVGEEGLSGELVLKSKANPRLAAEIEKNPGDIAKDLSEDFYIITKGGSKIKGDDVKVNKVYFTRPYGTRTVKPEYAFEILTHFSQNVV
ncbi:hypothetical protein [Yersinia kristensenii]|uniref:Uncharacterized protein n=1 Tax=Yersinia kristensenii TaxID=28152 RepID=A0A0T9KZ20_YERKR|nr:hypothetical protein [Yersinia kristensenii]CNE43080.1 Uncharacterised protein [Yersinia kristensenii]